MDTEEFKRIGEDLFGNSWQTRMARALGIDGSTVRRWVGAAIPVPPAIQAYLAMMGERQETRGALLYAMAGIGSPAGMILQRPEPFERMTKRLKFPGVDQLKPMPAILAPGGELPATLDAEAVDRIATDGVSYEITRHPDGRHMAGYLEAARREGHEAASIHNRHHHYTLIAHIDPVAPRIRHVIATHAGNVRMVQTTPGSPMQIVDERLGSLVGAGVQDVDRS